MKTLGLDLSLAATGMVVIDSDTLSPVLMTVLDTPAAKVGGLKRLEKIRSAICAVVREHNPSVVVLEGYSFGSNGRAFSLGELGGVVRLSLWKMEKTTFAVPPSTLKMFITGSGKSGEGAKGRVMLELFKRWGISTDDNNIADAAGLALAGVVLAKDRADRFTKQQVASLDKKVETICKFRLA